MKNLNQIRQISQALTKQRDSVLHEISRLNMTIMNKLEMLKKIHAYQHEYATGTHLNMSRSVPTLSKNLDSFTKKIKDIIAHEQREIDKLLKAKDHKLKVVQGIEQKIKVMMHFEAVVKHEMVIKKERSEVVLLDSMTSVKVSRGEYE